jgi:glutathione peroxidase
MLIVAFIGYVEIVNVNSHHMTYRQKFLKTVYPLWMWFTKKKGMNVTVLSNETIQPPVSFYSLKSVLNNGLMFDFSSLQGKKVLLVNSASDCGYTRQYDDLQKLYEQYSHNLVILGFPSNDFKEEERGSDEEIAQFCKLNYGVTFPLMKKSSVKKGEQQNPVYKWLTDSTQNGWNTKAPAWNFSKYLVNEKGMLVNYFGSSVPPGSKDIKEALEKNY